MTLYANGTLSLHAPIAADGAGISSYAVLAALAGHPRGQDLTVDVNCPGGDAFEGIAIYNHLAAMPGKVTIRVSGIALSAGSLIAMAGKEIIMAKGSLMMIHGVSLFVAGPVAKLQREIALIGKIDEQYAAIYASRAGKDIAAIKAAMEAETWYDGDEAVQAGLATRTEAERAIAFAAFDYRAYAKAPADLKALAAANGWTITSQDGADAAAEKARADRLQAELDRERQARAYEENRVAASAGNPNPAGLATPGGRGRPTGPANWSDFIPPRS